MVRNIRSSANESQLGSEFMIGPFYNLTCSKCFTCKSGCMFMVIMGGMIEFVQVDIDLDQKVQFPGVWLKKYFT